MNINYQTATKKDLFTLKLKGGIIDLGLVDMDDYHDLFTFCIEMDLLTYMAQRNYRGDVAIFKVLSGFVFGIMSPLGTHRANKRTHVIPVDTGDYIRLSELTDLNIYQKETHVTQGNCQHILWYDVPSETRDKEYKKWNFDV